MSHELELGTLLLGAITTLLAVAQATISLAAYVNRRQVPSLASDDATHDADGPIADFFPFSRRHVISPGIWHLYRDDRPDATYGSALWRKLVTLCGSSLIALTAGFAWGELMARNSTTSLTQILNRTSDASTNFLLFVALSLLAQLLHVVSQPRKAYTIEIRGLQSALFCLAFVLAYIQFTE